MDANSLHDLKGSISLRAQETGSGFRFFFDDDEESYFDLNLEKMADSEDLELQISFSPLPAAGFSAQQHPDDELFRNGRVLPFQSLQVAAETRTFLVPNCGEQQVYPAERLLLESSAPVDAAAGRVNLKAQVDSSSENVHCSESVRRRMEEEKQHQGLTGTRKTPNVTAKKKTNSGLMKFLIRFPSEKIRSTFMSILTSYHLLSPHPKRGQSEAGLIQERGRTYRRLVMQFSRWLAIRKRNHSKSSKDADASSSRRPNDVDLGEGVVRSILDAVDYAVGSRSREAGSGSGPRHSYSSPRSSREGAEGSVMERSSSINSAIAHCKMSYGNAARLP